MLTGAFGLFVFGLDWLYMRPDEVLVYSHTNGSLFHTIWYQARRDVQAPLWHAFFWTWRRMAGGSEFAARYQGVLWSSLTISLVYTLARTWFKAPRFGWFAVAALVSNAYFFSYAFEVRPYPLVMFAATLSMWLCWRWLMRPVVRRALLYGASLALLGYVHYFLAFLVAAQIVYVAAQRPNRTQLTQLAIAAGFAGLLWLPWAPNFVHQVSTLRQIDGGSLGIASTTLETTPDVIDDLLELATNGTWALWAVALLVGLVLVRRYEYGLLLLWALFVPIVNLTANLYVNVYAPRYVVYLVVGLALAAGVGLASLPFTPLRWGAMVLFVGLNLWQLPDHLPDRIPFRDVLTRMNTNSQPGDVVWFDEAKQTGDYVAWHIDAYLDDHLTANQVTRLAEAREARRVWHVTRDLFNPAVRERFYALENTHVLMLVTGNCDSGCFIAQLLETAPSSTPAAVFESPQYNDALPFYGVDVDHVTRERVAVRLWWMLDQPLTLDYSISLRLTDTTGAIIAQQDGPPLTKDSTPQPTSQIPADHITVDWRTLTLSPGITSGEYNLQLVVYQPVEGYTLTANTGETIVNLQTIMIP
jgi:hypothetical protein